MAYTAKDPCPPQHFMYLTETKSWKWEEGRGGEKGGGGEKVSLKTHATARGVGKNTEQLMFDVRYKNIEGGAAGGAGAVAQNSFDIRLGYLNGGSYNSNKKQTFSNFVSLF